MKLVAPPEKVFVIPKSVPAKLGERSTCDTMWADARAPLKNQPAHRRETAAETSQPARQRRARAAAGASCGRGKKRHW